MLESLFDSLGKLILIFLIICLSIWLILRLFGKYILQALIKRFSRKMNRQFQDFKQENAPPKEGKTTIAYDPGQSSTKKDNDGEYIDYEEID